MNTIRFPFLVLCCPPQPHLCYVSNLTQLFLINLIQCYNKLGQFSFPGLFIAFLYFLSKKHFFPPNKYNVLLAFLGTW